LLDRPAAPGHCQRQRGASLRELLQHATHARQCPMQIDGRRPRRCQRFDHVLQPRIAGIIGETQCDAIGSGGTDKRRATHLHGANGMGSILE